MNIALLSSESRTIAAQNILFLDAFRSIADQCEASHIPLVALKGISFFGRIYNPSERSLTDIDLLIAPEHFPDLKHILEEQGYVERLEEKWGANDFKTIFTKTLMSLEIVLEIHTRLTPDLPYHAWHRISHQNFEILSPQDELLYLAFHYAGQHTLLKTKWLQDIYLLSRNRPDMWNPHLWERATDLGVSSSLLFCAKALNVVYGFKAFTPSSARKYIAHSLLSLDFLENPTGHFFRYMLVKHLVKESLLKALTYDIQWFSFAVKQWFYRKR